MFDEGFPVLMTSNTVAHCATPYLQANNIWIYAQLTHLTRYRPIVLTQERLNAEEFAAAPVYSAELFTPLKRLANRLSRRLTGMYAFYPEILEREGARLLHAHFGHQGCRCLRTRRATGLPMVTSFYGYDASRDQADPRWRRIYRELFAEGDCFLAEGGAMARRLEEVGCPQTKVRVHHLGVCLDEIKFKPRAPDEGRIRFLICAHFREKKGIPYALQALARARAMKGFSCELVLVGDGPEKGNIERLLHESSLAEITSMRGSLSYPEVLGEISRCHLLMQTSVTARDGDSEGGAPVILLDAQAAGMPVIATRHADIPEYVRDEQSGLLAPEKDVEALAGCIIRLVDNPDRWSEMGKAGRRHIAEQYNAETQGVRLESIYDELLRTAPAARNSDAVHRPPRAHGPGSSDNSASILL